jgi:hypothetical protein
MGRNRTDDGLGTELVMVRLCSDDLKPVNERLGYRNAIQGLWRIYKDEGIQRLGRGMGATVTRSVIMNATQLSWYVRLTLILNSYDLIKARLLETGYFTDSIPLHLITAVLGGTVAVTACAPVDVMKSRIQSSTVSGLVSYAGQSHFHIRKLGRKVPHNLPWDPDDLESRCSFLRPRRTRLSCSG